MNQETRVLPEWKHLNVNELGLFVRGVSYRKEDAHEKPHQETIPILRATNIQNGELLLNKALIYVPMNYVKAPQYLRRGDIVVCMSSGSKHLVGKTAQLLNDWRGSFGTFCAVIRPNPEINSKYLGYYFSSPDYREFIRKKSSGININNLKPSDFDSLEIPVPSLPEQERIVARIEELFTQLDAGTAALKRAQAGLKRYKKSMLQSAYEGKLVSQCPGDEPSEKTLQRIGIKPLVIEDFKPLPVGWCWTTLGDLASLVTSGSRGWAKYYADIGDLFLRVGNFDRLTTTINLTNVVFVNAPNNSEGIRTQLKLNDILITITADVGMIGIVDAHTLQQSNKAYVNQHVGLVRLINPNFSEFIALALTTDSLQKQFQEKQYGATKKGFNLGDLKSLIIALPPLNEQERIKAEVEKRLSILQPSENILTINTLRTTRLRQSILRQAFEGKLS